MRPETGVSRGACQILIGAHRDMLIWFGVFVIAFGEAIIYQVDVVLFAGAFFANQKVIWFQIPVYVPFRMQVLDSLNNLVCYHKHSL